MTTTAELHTEYAPAERESTSKLHEQAAYFYDELAKLLIDSTPDVFLILNDKRQIVFANSTFLNSRELSEEEILGQRPGETLQCSHALSAPCGCGTSEFCRTCGAVNAILASLNGKMAVEECRITQVDGDALDLRVWANPLDVRGERFTTFALKDISNEKRRRALERIFFHDIMNTAGTVAGIAEMFNDAEEGELDELAELLHRTSSRLIEEIKAQKELAAAENDELQVAPFPICTQTLLEQLVLQYREHAVAVKRHLRIHDDSADLVFTTDMRLLQRVLGNMIKNALEASKDGDTVTISCEATNTCVRFYVHNPTFIPRRIQLQLFQRSFSTKGSGRGLGTYSMKLLTERYLQGHISFCSAQESGTTFTVEYPYSI